MRPENRYQMVATVFAVLLCPVGLYSAQTDPAMAPDPATEESIDLFLLPPETQGCGLAWVNGAVGGPDPVALLEWDWGDGTVTRSWFPATHAYIANGQYTVTVTALSTTCETAVVTESVDITDVGEPGCPQEKAQCLYLAPHNLHLVDGATSTEPFRALDHQGNQVDGTLSFDGYDPTLISIDAGGFVTALRQEEEHEIGDWVTADLNGLVLANRSIVRVLSQDYGVTFEEIRGENTALYYPTDAPNYPGDLQQFVLDHEIPTVNEYAFTIQRDLLQADDFLNGCRQVFEVDFGEGEGQRVCGINGNPIRLGWNITGNPGQNCFAMPHWFVYYHELAHNLTFSSSVFGHMFSGLVEYIEGLASVPSVAAMEEILSDPGRYPLGSVATDSLEADFLNMTQNVFANSLQDWLAAGAPFENLDANIVDGIWLEHQSGVDYARRFHEPLASKNSFRLCSVWSQALSLGTPGKHTFFASLVSTAADEDLSGIFANDYNYPIDQDLFDFAYQEMSSLLLEIFADGFESGSTSSWSNTVP